MCKICTTFAIYVPILHQVNTYAGIMNEAKRTNEQTDQPNEQSSEQQAKESDCSTANTRSISMALFSLSICTRYMYVLFCAMLRHGMYILFRQHYVLFYYYFLINCTDAANTISVLFGASKCSVDLICMCHPHHKVSSSIFIP